MNPVTFVGLFAFGIAVFCCWLILRAIRLPSGSNLQRGLGVQKGAHLGSLAHQVGAQQQENRTTWRASRELSQSSKKKSGKAKESLEDLLFKAGYFGREETSKFHKRQILCTFVFGLGSVLALVLLKTDDPLLLVAALIIGPLVGYRFPVFGIDRRIKDRQDEITFFLPLVIEQVSIGVSSSLDIGPCLYRVITMADERDTHNVVTEYLRLALLLVKSGSSLEESLREVGDRSGSTALKQAFIALSQVAKHGGEVSKQLQELSSSVTSQREVEIETKIKKLELKATAPVAVAFLGFMIILGSSLVAVMMKGLNG